MNFEIVRPNPAPGLVRVALFDFDGTVSLLRMGWQQIMVGLIAEIVPRVDGESSADVLHKARDLVQRTNGLPTLYQMQAMVDLAQNRGGAVHDALTYKRLYLDRLNNRVRPRLAALEAHPEQAEEWQVPGTRQMLMELRRRGVVCFLASGSDQSAVRVETAALGLSHYFVNIFGATTDVEGSTKAALFNRLGREHGLGPGELVIFGDGVEEIRLAKECGRIAVGIARDERDPELIDPNQRARLIATGADVIIRDFREHAWVTKYLFEPATNPNF
jgi:phosphoglycolate phosphatase